MTLAVLDNTPRQALMRDLLAYYPLDSLTPALWGAGAAPADLLLTNNGTATFNAAGPTTNLPGSVTLNGTTQWLSHADSHLFRLGARDFTISMWIKPTDATPAAVGAVLSKGVAATNTREWRLYNNTGGTVEFGLSAAGTSYGASAAALSGPSDGAWGCLQFLFSAGPGSGLIQFNRGGYNVVSKLSAAMFTGAGGFAIGAQGDAGALPFAGDIAHLGIWTGLLSQQALDWIYNNGAGRDLRRGA